jgi:hypothetical protein
VTRGTGLGLTAEPPQEASTPKPPRYIAAPHVGGSSARQMPSFSNATFMSATQKPMDSMLPVKWKKSWQ